MTAVREIMTTDVITLEPDTEIVKATQLLLDNRINGAPVVDGNGRVIGILCQSDLIAQQKKLPLPSVFAFLESLFPLASTKKLEREVRKIAALTAADAMTPEPVTVTPDTDLETVAALMVDSNFHTLPVVEHDRLVGVVGKEDVLKTLIRNP